MRKTLFTLLLCGYLLATYAQEETRSPHAMGAKLLFVDYGTPNDIDDLKITNGLEVLYSYNLNRWLNIAIPVKAGVMNVMEDINNRNFVSIDGLLQLNLTKPSSRLIPYLFGGAGIVGERDAGSNFQIPAGLGFNIRVGKNSYVNLQGEYRLSNTENRDNLQAGLGYIYRLGQSQQDTDRDGTPDATDACPKEPGPEKTMGCPDRDTDGIADKNDQCPDAKGTEATQGCPDQDGDGFADNKDECPTIAGKIKGCPDTDGDGIADKEDQCPEAAGTEATRGCPDRDNDGIADQFDDCPDQAGIAANRGCPIKDTDSDGVPDEMDKCPTEKGTTATMGCPDRDGDGVIDSQDRCPDKAGTFAGCPDSDGDGLVDPDDACPNEAGPTTNRGCPELKEEVKEVLEFAMRAVQFETGRATLKPESYPVLDQIVQIMKQYPVYSLRISGHTDNVGSDSTNKILSEQRAKTCYEYLAASGIDATRMSFYGFGEIKPIASNNTAEGKRLNRRTEFELYIK